MRRRDFIMVGGAAVTWPFAAQAQQKPRIPTVGILWHAGGVAEEAIFLTQIQQGLKDLGYVEGRDITLVNTFADEQYERFKSNAAECAERVQPVCPVTLIDDQDARGTVAWAERRNQACSRVPYSLSVQIF